MVLDNIRFRRTAKPLQARLRVHTYVRPRSSTATESAEADQETVNLTILLVRCYAEGCLASSDVLLRANEDPVLYRLLPVRPVTVNSLRRFRRCHLSTLTQALAATLETESGSTKSAEALATERIRMAQLLDVGLEDD